MFDDANYHYAISKDGGHHFRIYRAPEFVEHFTTMPHGCDEESGVKHFNWNEVVRELLRLDKGVACRIANT